MNEGISKIFFFSYRPANVCLVSRSIITNSGIILMIKKITEILTLTKQKLSNASQGTDKISHTKKRCW